MELTQEIATAIGEASKRYGSNAALAKLVKTTGATVGKWRNGIIKHIEDDSWKRLHPHLLPWLSLQTELATPAANAVRLPPPFSGLSLAARSNNRLCR